MLGGRLGGKGHGRGRLGAELEGEGGLWPRLARLGRGRRAGVRMRSGTRVPFCRPDRGGLGGLIISPAAQLTCSRCSCSRVLLS